MSTACSSTKNKEDTENIKAEDSRYEQYNHIECENNTSNNFNESSTVYIKHPSPNEENVEKNIDNSDLPASEKQTDSSQPCNNGRSSNFFGVVSIDKARKSLGKRYLRLTRSMDRVFSGNRSDFNEENRSYLRLETQATYFENGNFDQDISLRAKLDLPRTKHKFQLYFDSQFNDEQSIQERNTTASSGETLNRRGSTAGIEYGKQEDDSPWYTGVRVGAETEVPLRTFIRLKVGRWWDHNAVFSTKFQQDLWHLDGVGWGETTYIDFKAKASENVYFLLENELEYADDPFPISYFHSFNVLHRISDKSRIRYRIAALGSDDEDNIVDRYLANIVYTYRLHQDWLFVSFIPEIIFRGQYQNDRDFANDPQPVPSDWEPWKAEGAITIKFDIFTN